MGCKIIAHRGANKKAPQNTLPAFITAINENTDGFETDVHLTKDNIPVICHNPTIDATSNGVGAVENFTLEELKKFDFGAYFSQDFVNTPLPTLDEFLEVTSKSSAEIINIELKNPKTKSVKLLVSKTLECVKKYGVLDRVIISSFSAPILKEVKVIDSRCKTAFLYPTTDFRTARPQINPFFTVKSTGCDIIHPVHMVVTKTLVDIAHKMGLQVNVWTVNAEKTIKKLIDCGVDGLITDCPLETRAIVEAYEKRKK